MIPLKKVQDLITNHDNLEKELSSSNIDTKLFAKKSKEYANLGNIISTARKYVTIDGEKKDLEQILLDKNNESEMVEMAENDLSSLKVKKKIMKIN